MYFYLPFYWSIQLDESTDITNCAHLMPYVRFFNIVSLQEEFLFCRSLPDCFEALNAFIQETHIIWGHCREICADGAGCHSSMMKQVKVVAVWKHCITHGKALVTKKMPEELQAFPVEAVNFINLIKSGAITACAF